MTMTLKAMTDKQTIFNSEAIRIPTPDGTLNVFIMENADGIPFEIQVVIGKSGSALAAWANTAAALCSMLLQTNACKLADLAQLLQSQNGDKTHYTDSREPVRSGPDGLALAFIKYQNGKFAKIRETLGIKDVDSIDIED